MSTAPQTNPNVLFVDPAATLTFADGRLYKARWALEAEDAQP